MPGTFHLQIVTQQGVKLDTEVESLRARSVDGYFGVRPGHAPMVAELLVGHVLVRQPGQPEAEVLACSGGIVEIYKGGVVILADAAELSSEIDVERAREAARRAQERLERRREPAFDTGRAAASLARAINRLKAAQQEE
jgi:F-type H+-transporting ATPase subunit epsilon